MSRTESTMVKLGTKAPAFELVDVKTGKVMGRDDVAALVWDENLTDAVNLSAHGGPAKKHGLLVMFVCPHCPYVKHLEMEIGRIGRDYFAAGAGPIAMCAIQSNDVVEYPDDGPDGMREQAARCGWEFPYLLDELQETARAYDAACTPDFFLFDAEMSLVYRGQMDASRPKRGDFGNGAEADGKELRAALEAVTHGKRPDPNQTPSIGCNIKWKQ